jgi:hypothetical protein
MFISLSVQILFLKEPSQKVLKVYLLFNIYHEPLQDHGNQDENV